MLSLPSRLPLHRIEVGLQDKGAILLSLSETELIVGEMGPKQDNRCRGVLNHAHMTAANVCVLPLQTLLEGKRPHKT